jgi:Trk-type K+ transport system membrane component
VTTFAVLVLATWAQLKGQPDVEIAGRRIPPKRVLQALALTVVAMITVLLVTTLLNYLDRAQYKQLLFEAVSALGTVGLSTGITPRLSPAAKVLVSLAMFAGRVGPLTLASTLVARSRPASVRLPEGEVVIG